MAPYGPEPETPGARRQVTLAGVVFVVALSVPYMSDGLQQEIAVTLQSSALAPFIAMQERLAEGRARADQIDFLQAELDSLVAATVTQSALVDENRELREMLGLADRAGPRFLPATVLRPGTPGSESMFLVNVGSEDGVQEGAPIVNARGLVGVILEVRPESAVGMDWTHPDFRASAMLPDGSAFGLVENVRGDFREEDRLMMNGTAYHETLPRGSLVVTSGLGIIPRGIPIGRIDATAEVQGSWRKSYWLRPLVELGSVTHVLVETVSGGDDVTDLWPRDSTALEADSPRTPARVTSPRPGPPAVTTAPPAARPTPPVVRTDPPAAAPQAVPTAPRDTTARPPDTTATPPDTAAARADTLPPPTDTAGVRPDTTSLGPDSASPGADSTSPPRDSLPPGTR